MSHNGYSLTLTWTPPPMAVPPPPTSPAPKVPCPPNTKWTGTGCAPMGVDSLKKEPASLGVEGLLALLGLDHHGADEVACCSKCDETAKKLKAKKLKPKGGDDGPSLPGIPLPLPPGPNDP
jgi:hypothetical protein